MDRNVLSHESLGHDECVVRTGLTGICGFVVYLVSVDGKSSKLLVYRLTYFVKKSLIQLCSDKYMYICVQTNYASMLITCHIKGFCFCVIFVSYMFCKLLMS